MNAAVEQRELLEKMNGFSGARGVRETGRLVIPARAGRTVTLEIAGPFRARDLLVREYWRSHPRFIFFKSVVANARLIDVGAGSGGMIGWKGWDTPARLDIDMCAVDIFRGEHFDRYADFDIVELGVTETKFGRGSFDAAIASHVVEHIADREALAREIYRVCAPGAKVYVEWPTHHSGGVIGREALQSFGVNCSTINFFDDETHLELITLANGEAAFEKAGFSTVASGEIANDFLYPELFRCGFAEFDSEVTTYALWLALRFSQYLIVEKP